ncbi:phage portal protein [Paraburkholderia tropica]|uniref:phage portal protein n=1 Tax=Paraburkholderia tropica TaxID=92647 RepID=UPI00160A3EE8|nr:phage portal protein [Paraburkholderia tropica]MBB6319253.1 lambda family phage portal protein [Paraburkholderia tropica]
MAQSNFLDRVIGYFNPAAGLQRTQARAMSAYLDGSGYVGADTSRRSMRKWFAVGGSPDRDTLRDLPTLRARSRDLLRNAPLALGAINTNVTSVIGTGLTLNPTIDHEALGMEPDEAATWQRKTQAEFRQWCEQKEQFDIEAKLDFYQAQAVAFRGALESGDIFVSLPYELRPGGVYGLKVQLIESDRCCNPDNKADVEGGFKAGVMQDEAGRAQQYAFARYHPGDYRAGQSWQIVQAFGAKTGRRNVLHIFEYLRPGFRRGVPYLAPVIEALKQLGRYTEAELMAAVVSGMFTVFIEQSNAGSDPDAAMDGFAGQPGTGDGGDEMALGYGAVGFLGPGEKASVVNPGRPNALFDPFVKSILTQVGVALQLPLEVLIKHFAASYSASRAALLEAWRFFKVRRQWISSEFCQPVYEAWLAEAVSSGRIAAPGFFADPAIRFAYSQAEWLGDGPGSLDPLKEVTAAVMKVDNDLSNVKKETAALDGSDWRANMIQRGEEVKLRRSLGLVIPATVPIAGAAPSAPADNAD